MFASSLFAIATVLTVISGFATWLALETKKRHRHCRSDEQVTPSPPPESFVSSVLREDAVIVPLRKYSVRPLQKTYMSYAAYADALLEHEDGPFDADDPWSMEEIEEHVAELERILPLIETGHSITRSGVDNELARIRKTLQTKPKH